MSLSTFFLEKILLKADLKFKNFLEEKNKDENKIINNRDLIIKKNLEDNFFNNYKKTVSSIENENNTKDLFFTFFWVIPSYFFVPFSDFWILAFLQGLGKNALLATKVFARIFSGVKKMIERLRYYPFFLFSFKRIEKFLSQEERNDIQKNILISEKINNLTFDKVFFGYEKNKLVLEKFSMNFEMGKINYLNAENGFGKSTIVSLILGLYLPNSGEITINNKYKINEINLIEWRKKISYAENENLIEENLSSGQKQLIELNSALKRIKEKEIIIFDEADSCLDEEKRNDFRKYLKTQAKDKIIIFISHI